MHCPRCGSANDRVLDSRSDKEVQIIRRRRECSECGCRFSTVETLVPEELVVVKKDGRHEDFSPDKLRNGLANACYRRLTPDKVEEVVRQVSASLQYDFEKEVSSAEIGHRVMVALRRIDQVAYVRFVSVYREFSSVDEFIEEIKSLK